MMKVLLVEDEPDNQLVIQDIFEFGGIDAQLVIVDNAEEALCVAAEMLPVLVLMDIRLPGMSGLDATRKLKAGAATRRIPVWAITAYAMAKDEPEALAAGCDDYITKPIDGEQLTQRLREFVAQRRGVKAA